MIGKEIKRLNRRELVDIIYHLKKNEQQMQEKIEALEKALEEKRLRISEAGSIAKAATDITDIFSTAQTTADLYLNEIACMKEDTEKECAKMIEESGKTVEKMLADARKQCDELNEKYQKDYKEWQQLQEEIRNLKALKAPD